MGKASRTSAWVAAASVAAPVVLTPSVAWAANDTAVIAASAISGVVGAAVGAGVASGLGYRAIRRERAAYEELLYGQGVAEKPARATTPAHGAKGPQVAPGHAALSAQAAPESAHPARHIAENNPYLDALSDTGDLAEVAVAYVADKSMKERMGQRAKGVRAVLSERMGKNMLDDMPVIMRADGSVGDVGTSWWDPAVSSAFGVEAIQARELANRVNAQPEHMPAPVSEVPQVPQTPQAYPPLRIPRTPQASATSFSPASAPAVPAAMRAAPVAPASAPRVSVQAPEPTVAQLIASRVPQVVEEAYPEIGRAWNSQDDHWERALAALDERVEDNLMGERLERAYQRIERSRVGAPEAFSDGIGTIETIDEPDGLERDTAFLSFKAPGNHPEVQDTASYINYLIGDEFRRNPSRQARRQARSFLKLHEGGTHAEPQVQAM